MALPLMVNRIQTTMKSGPNASITRTSSSWGMVMQKREERNRMGAILLRQQIDTCTQSDSISQGRYQGIEVAPLRKVDEQVKNSQPYGCRGDHAAVGRTVAATLAASPLRVMLEDSETARVSSAASLGVGETRRGKPARKGTLSAERYSRRVHNRDVVVHRYCRGHNGVHHAQRS